MKLLTEPFGHGTGDSISLVREGGDVDDTELTEVLLSYSCYPPAIPKILACVRHSRRYDSVLRSIWFRAQFSQLTRDLAALGVGRHLLRCLRSQPRHLHLIHRHRQRPDVDAAEAAGRNALGPKRLLELHL